MLEQFPPDQYIISIYISQYHQHATELTEQAIKNGADTIAVVGGTGTVHQVLQKIAYTDIKLSIFPTGCSNGYARYINLTNKFDEFLKTLKKDHSEKIDIGEVRNNKKAVYFINWFCSGSTALIAKELEGNAAKSFASYIFKGIKLLLRKKIQNNLSIDFHHFYYDSNFHEVVIGNIPSYRGTLSHQTKSSVVDGNLHILLIESISTSDMLSYAFRALRTGNDDLFDLSDIHKSSSVTLNYKTKTLVHADFEPFELEGKVVVQKLQQHIHLILNPDNKL